VNFEDEEYVRLRKSPGDSALGWEGRTVLWHLMLACDRAGLLEFPSTDNAVEVISVLTSIPAGVARVGLVRCLDLGALTQESTGIRIIGFEGRFRNRRARHWSKAAYPDVYERDGSTCRYCGSCDPDALSVDHVIPRCLGGTDDAGNLVVACMSCNRQKGGRTPQQAGMVLR